MSCCRLQLSELREKRASTPDLSNSPERRTQEVDAVVAIAEPAGGARRREVDAVVREVCPRHGAARQVVVAAHVRRRVPEHVQRRHLRRRRH